VQRSRADESSVHHPPVLQQLQEADGRIEKNGSPSDIDFLGTTLGEDWVVESSLNSDWSGDFVMILSVGYVAQPRVARRQQRGGTIFA
jgi:hypothetical protein